MKRPWKYLAPLCAMVVLTAFATQDDDREPRSRHDRKIDRHARRTIDEGRQTFRFDTFGGEAFWGDTLKLHQAIAGSAFGGIGPGLSPRAALALGLKVDSEALPANAVHALKHGRVNLDDPAVTLELLRRDAVIGIKGFFDPHNNLRSVGIQCALCHSRVDNSVAAGIGRRLDGWANRDLNVGAIVNLAPDLSAFVRLLGVSEATVRKVLASRGPGKFDAELILDGKAFRPDGKSAATLIPPAFGLAGVNLHTWTGWGSVTHWNAFVANLEMHGKGTFYDPRLNDPLQFPIAAQNGFGDVRSDPDLITAKLPALHLYQLAIPAPTAPVGSFDADAAQRGKRLFENKARCASCHVPPLYTEPGWNMHTPAEIGIDDFQANALRRTSATARRRNERPADAHERRLLSRRALRDCLSGANAVSAASVSRLGLVTTGQRKGHDPQGSALKPSVEREAARRGYAPTGGNKRPRSGANRYARCSLSFRFCASMRSRAACQSASLHSRSS